MSIGHLCLLWRNVCLGLLPIFWLGCFLVIELYELFIYFDALDGCIICKYFLPVCRLAFHFVYVFLCCTEACKFDLVPFVFCLFVCLLLFILSWETDVRKYWYNLCQIIFSPMFFSRHFIVSCLIFRSLSHVSLFLCMLYGCVLTSLICMQLSNFPSTTCWSGGTVFFPLFILASFVVG